MYIFFHNLYKKILLFSQKNGKASAKTGNSLRHSRTSSGFTSAEITISLSKAEARTSPLGEIIQDPPA